MSVAGIILAAGRSTRFHPSSEQPTKLVALLRDEPVVRRVANIALEAGVHPLIAVTGHAREAVESALAGLEILFVHNQQYYAGLSTSLKAGLAAVPHSASGALVMLGDMPFVKPETVQKLIAALETRTGNAVAIVPSFNDAWGNPVLLSSALYDRVMSLQGDEGARALLLRSRDSVIEVFVDDDGVLADIDRQEQLQWNPD
jgi:molybdenum cofactor cytidylyltransferase